MYVCIIYVYNKYLNFLITFYLIFCQYYWGGSTPPSKLLGGSEPPRPPPIAAPLYQDLI